jgi:hypothetical protein
LHPDGFYWGAHLSAEGAFYLWREAPASLFSIFSFLFSDALCGAFSPPRRTPLRRETLSFIIRNFPARSGV